MGNPFQHDGFCVFYVWEKAELAGATFYRFGANVLSLLYFQRDLDGDRWSDTDSGALLHKRLTKKTPTMPGFFRTDFQQAILAKLLIALLVFFLVFVNFFKLGVNHVI